MSYAFEQTPVMSLLAYELLTDHGLALPLFGTSATANALHVAVPSKPGDPAATIAAFEVYDAEAASMLDISLHRVATIGAAWIDVFLWNGSAHVGTRSELWAQLGPARDDLARLAPLTLLALVDGIDIAETVRCAVAAHEWLVRDWGAKHADNWRLNSFIRRQAYRELYRRFDDDVDVVEMRAELQELVLTLRPPVLELRLPRAANLGSSDLPGLASAAAGFGWRLEIVSEKVVAASATTIGAGDDRVLLMRLRHGRGRTQTQIPLRVVDQFFGRDRTVRDLRTGRLRTMTLSMAGERRNTMKLQLPELAGMADPVAKFVRSAAGVQFELHDSSSAEGESIASLLDAGLRDGTTLRTQGGATWWRLLPAERAS